jgi:hypothetical protein
LLDVHLFVLVRLLFPIFSLQMTFFLFLKAEESQAQAMKNILTVYEAASGQAISLPKFEIYCVSNVSTELRGVIADIIGVQSVLGTGKY